MNCDFTRFCKSLHDINVIRETCGPVITNPRIDDSRKTKLLRNVGRFGGNGWWWELTVEDVGGRVAVNDSCKGTINGDGMSFASCGMSFFNESVARASGPAFLGTSGAGKSQRARSPFTIATEALMSCGTCVDSPRQELYSDKHLRSTGVSTIVLTLSLSRMAFP
jgi:hypothetical protein